MAPPFLAHEKNRCVGRQAKEKGNGPVGSRRDELMQALTKGAVADLIMIGDAMDEAGR